MGKIKSIVATNAAAMQRQFLNTQKSANSAAGAMTKLAGAATLIGIAFLTHGIKNAAKFGASIDDNSQKLGINAEQYQELSYAAKLAGMEQEDFQKSMEMFTKRLGEVKLGGTEAEKTLGKLGLKMADVKGKSPAEALRIIADRLQRVQDPMQKNAILADLFGKAGVRMALMLNQGSAGLTKMAVEARALGMVLSNETIEKAAKLDDEFDRLGLAAKVAGVNLSVGFLPAITELRRIFTSPGFQEGVKGVGEEMGKFVKFLVDNRDTIVIVSTALIGLKAGLALGRATGVPVLGALVGGLAGAAVGAELATSEISKLEREVNQLESKAQTLRTTLAPSGMAGVRPNDPLLLGIHDDLIKTQFEIEKTKGKIAELKARAAEAPDPTAPAKNKIDIYAGAQAAAVEKALEDLVFKTQIAKNEFKGLSDGFPELAHGLKLFGQSGVEVFTSVEKLSPALQKLHAGFLKLKTAQTEKENRSAFQVMAEGLHQLEMQFATGQLSADAYARAVFKIKDAYRQTTGIGVDLQGVAKGIGDAFGSALESAIVDAKSLQEVLQALYKDLLRVLARKMITEPIGNFISSGLSGMFNIPGKALGGPVMAGQMYEVGERGRELFVPNTNGTIVPNNQLHKLGPSGDSVSAPIVVNLDARGADRDAIMRSIQMLKAELPAVAVQAIRQARSRRVEGV